MSRVVNSLAVAGEVSRIWSAVLVQTNAWGEYVIGGPWSDVGFKFDRAVADRRGVRMVSPENPRSTKLSREQLVGVKCR